MEFFRKIYWLIFTTIFSLLLFTIRQCYNTIIEQDYETYEVVNELMDINPIFEKITPIHNRKMIRDSMLITLSRNFKKIRFESHEKIFSFINKNISEIEMDLTIIEANPFDEENSSSFAKSNPIRGYYIELNKILNKEKTIWNSFFSSFEKIRKEEDSVLISASLERAFENYKISNLKYFSLLGEMETRIKDSSKKQIFHGVKDLGIRIFFLISIIALIRVLVWLVSNKDEFINSEKIKK